MELKSYISRGIKYIIKGQPIKNIRADISYLLQVEVEGLECLWHQSSLEKEQMF